MKGFVCLCGEDVWLLDDDSDLWDCCMDCSGRDGC
jgi:hypothetical protein